MPELPEVETVRRDLERELADGRMVAVWTSGKPLRLARPIDVAALRAACVGARVEKIRRRAKYLLVDLDSGFSVLVHLGMSGSLRWDAHAAPRPRHTHVAWRVTQKRRADGEVRFVDPRRFGLVTVVDRAHEDRVKELKILGVDPLEPPLDGPGLAERIAGSRRSIKEVLLDQTRVAGLGNIYACEALFQAKIDPRRSAGQLAARRLEVLAAAIVSVLQRGIANRGTTLRDYVDPAGLAGTNQTTLRVYGREGGSCPRADGGRIRRIAVQGRATFFCPSCQR